VDELNDDDDDVRFGLTRKCPSASHVRWNSNNKVTMITRFYNLHIYLHLFAKLTCRSVGIFKACTCVYFCRWSNWRVRTATVSHQTITRSRSVWLNARQTTSSTTAAAKTSTCRVTFFLTLTNFTLVTNKNS